jgi:hypothetical protein
MSYTGEPHEAGLRLRTQCSLAVGKSGRLKSFKQGDVAIVCWLAEPLTGIGGTLSASGKTLAQCMFYPDEVSGVEIYG